MKPKFTSQVSICHKDNCIHAEGKNADTISAAAAIMLIFFGIAAIAYSAN